MAAARSRFGDDTRFLIGINGSYARREATEDSDVDFFFLATNIAAWRLRRKYKAFRQDLAANLGMKHPAPGGVFEKPLSVDKICKIGGQDDSNVTLTRRMLLLLEGEWVFNEPAFGDTRSRLLEKYLHYKPGENKICMYLLNDIVRYWRTICIDLEYKSYAGNKSRELRLIKLRFLQIAALCVWCTGDRRGSGSFARTENHESA